MKYTTRIKCKDCKEDLVRHELLLNDGVCPYCGVESVGINYNVETEIGHWERERTWKFYIFPQTKYTWIKKD